MSYRVSKRYDGVYFIFDDEGERVARVASWLPGPMVFMDAQRIMSPAMAKAVAQAMQRLANDLERES